MISIEPRPSHLLSRLTGACLLLLMSWGAGCQRGDDTEQREREERARAAQPYVEFYEGLARVSAEHPGDCLEMGAALESYLDAQGERLEEIRERAASGADMLLEMKDEARMQRSITAFTEALQRCQEEPSVQRVILRISAPEEATRTPGVAP